MLEKKVLIRRRQPVGFRRLCAGTAQKAAQNGAMPPLQIVIAYPDWEHIAEGFAADEGYGRLKLELERPYLHCLSTLPSKMTILFDQLVHTSGVTSRL